MNITTLVSDIQSRLISSKPFDAETVEVFAKNLAKKLAVRLSERQAGNKLRLSNLGTACARKLYYSVNRPELAEPLPASARLKFLFGDIIEEVILFLARASGHRVESEQAEVELHGVPGHIDGLVDGALVDVKSASAYGFQKFKSHGLAGDDPFGYLIQLGSYGAALNLDEGHFIAVEKSLGHIALDTWKLPKKDYARLVADRQAMLAQPEPPDREYSDEPDGKSGNRKLGLACSYCPFKLVCWPGVRAFKYSRKPVFLTVVSRQPDVPELRVGEFEE